MDQLKWCSDNTGSLNREVSTSDQNGGGQQALADWQVLCQGGGANGDHRRGQVIEDISSFGIGMIQN